MQRNVEQFLRNHAEYSLHSTQRLELAHSQTVGFCLCIVTHKRGGFGRLLAGFEIWQVGHFELRGVLQGRLKLRNEFTVVYRIRVNGSPCRQSNSFGYLSASAYFLLLLSLLLLALLLVSLLLLLLQLLLWSPLQLLLLWLWLLLPPLHG